MLSQFPSFDIRHPSRETYAPFEVSLAIRVDGRRAAASDVVTDDELHAEAKLSGG